jgi:ligand-binding sensor domain-containing protein
MMTAQTLSPTLYSLDPDNKQKVLKTIALKTNQVTEIELYDESTIWLGTSRGLAMIDDLSKVTTLDSLKLSDGINEFYEDAVSAIGSKDSQLMFAGSTITDGISVGTGLYLTGYINNKITPVWEVLEQPIDAPEDSLEWFGLGQFRCLPITTPFQNLTYDIAFGGGYIWIVSWAGGLRRMNPYIDDYVWERIPLPQDNQVVFNTCDDDAYINVNGELILADYYLNPRDPSDGGNHNHKTFSVISYGDTIWVGTANGVNRGIIGDGGCIDWVHFSFPVDGLAGNFVVGLAVQDWEGIRTIWAATVNADNPEENRGLSYTTDAGLSWEIVPELLGERVFNVSAQDSIIVVSTETGYWIKNDLSAWEKFNPAVNSITYSGNEILTPIVYDAVIDARDTTSSPVIWIATPDGVARSNDLRGFDWTIFQAEYDQEEVYAYPNPFSPLVHNQIGSDGWVRFHTGNKAISKLTMQIYDFQLKQVYRKNFDFVTGDGSVKWNGRDNRGDLVANGVYFVRLKWFGGDHWVKLVVVK